MTLRYRPVRPVGALPRPVDDANIDQNMQELLRRVNTLGDSSLYSDVPAVFSPDYEWTAHPDNAARFQLSVRWWPNGHTSTVRLTADYNVNGEAQSQILVDTSSGPPYSFVREWTGEETDIVVSLTPYADGETPGDAEISGIEDRDVVLRVLPAPVERSQRFAEIDIAVSKPADSTIQIDVTLLGEFTASWSAWCRLGAWPTSDGTVNGSLLTPYQFVSNEPRATRTATKWADSTSTWYLIVVAYNDFGEAGERVSGTVNMAGAITGALSDLTAWADPPAGGGDTDGEIVLEWSHNTEADSVAYTVDIYVTRSINGAAEEEVTVVTGRDVRLEEGGTDSTPLHGSYRDTSFPVRLKNDGFYQRHDYRIVLKESGVAGPEYYVTAYAWGPLL